MRKFILFIITLPFVLLGSMFFLIPYLFLRRLTRYQRLTFEEVKALGKLDEENDTETLKVRFGLKGEGKPDDYGFKDWTELEHTYIYYSLYDKKALEAWYVPPAINEELADKTCIVLLHGMFSNRLRTTKYLELFKETGLDKKYHFFIPDLRNSGKADVAHTGLGYHFAEDISATLLFIQKQFKIQNIIIYAFSMGAMGTAVMWGRKDLREKIESAGIHIRQVIFDSPLCDADGILWKAAHDNLPQQVAPFFYRRVKTRFSRHPKSILGGVTDGMFEQMKISVLLEDFPCPILVLQNVNDDVTPYYDMKKEMENIGHAEIVLFEGRAEDVPYLQYVDYKQHQELIKDDGLKKEIEKGREARTNKERTHVMMFIRPEYRQQYIDAVYGFLSK